MTPDTLSQADGAECAAPAILNEAQQAAVEAREPVIYVPAGPGSGKTKTLVARIHSLIADGVEPREIVVISYTNAAAKEIMDRLGDVPLGYLGTLHGFCFRLLQGHGQAIGFRPGISLATEDVAEELFKETAKTMGWKGSLKAARESGDRKADLVRRAYRDALKRSNMADFETVLEEGLTLIQSRACPVFADLLVDEVQDSAIIDWRIYDEIQADRKFLVGDGDQSIYSFRGAMPHLFVQRCEEPGAVVIPLELNYRSDVFICEQANRLIVNNKVRIPKFLLPVSEAMGVITKEAHLDHIYEQRSVAGWIRQRFEQGIPWNEIAVLLRTNALVESYRIAIESAGIPLQRPESIDLPADWNKALDLIGLWLNPSSDVLAKRVFKNVNRIKVLALQKGCSIFEAAKEYGFIDHITNLPQLPEQLARQGIDRGTTELIAARIEALPQRDPTLSDLASDLFALQRVPMKPDAQGVFVGTLHSAKGREWDAVALPGWEEGIVPSLSKTSDIEDERRLAFVGLTRARHHLLITWAAKRDTQWKKGIEAPPSRFIGEMDLADRKQEGHA